MQVSAHFYIRRNGELWQFVSCDERAWHAGASSYRGRDNCNDDSIGIELEGLEGEPFEAAAVRNPGQPVRRPARSATRCSTSPGTSTSRPAARPTPAPASSGRVCSSRWAGRLSVFPKTSPERADTATVPERTRRQHTVPCIARRACGMHGQIRCMPRAWLLIDSPHWRSLQRHAAHSCRPVTGLRASRFSRHVTQSAPVSDAIHYR